MSAIFKRNWAHIENRIEHIAKIISNIRYSITNPFQLCSGEQRGKPTFDLYVAKPTSSSVPSPNGMANGCASAGTISAIETTTSPHTPRRSTVQLGMANQSDSLKRNMIQVCDFQ